MSIASNGDVWLTNSSGVVRYSKGVFTRFPAPNLGSPYSLYYVGPSLAVAPDNSVYTYAGYLNNSPHPQPPTGCALRFPPRGPASAQSCAYDNGSNDVLIGPDNRFYNAGNLYYLQQWQLPSLCCERDLTLPDGYTTSLALAAGEDGAVWLAAQCPGTDCFGALYRITSALTITKKLVLPKSQDSPSRPYGGLVWGPDDALWFTESNNNRIGRITGWGAVREFPLPTPASNPQGLTVGGDGALWFTENAGNKIGRITMSGRITEYHIPTANSGPLGIAAPRSSLDPHTLWFVETNANKLGEVKF